MGSLLLISYRKNKTKENMNKRLEKEVKAFHKEKLKIFPSEMPSSWQMTSIIAENFFNRGYEQAREKLYSEIERLKAKAEQRYDEIGKSGYINPNEHLAKGTDNLVSAKYANEKNKEHAANLGYYNGMSRAFEFVLGLLKK